MSQPALKAFPIEFSQGKKLRLGAKKRPRAHWSWELFRHFQYQVTRLNESAREAGLELKRGNRVRVQIRERESKIDRLAVPVLKSTPNLVISRRSCAGTEEMYLKACFIFKIVVLLIRPVMLQLFPLSLPSPLQFPKDPINLRQSWSLDELARKSLQHRLDSSRQLMDCVAQLWLNLLAI